MQFLTLLSTIGVVALVQATPAMIRRYGNETLSELPSLTGSGLETMPTALPSNETITPPAAPDVSMIITTVVDVTTLTYTLGPEGSSSVVTTVIESTSTITMTSTFYVTVTMPGEEPLPSVAPPASGTDVPPTDSPNPTATDIGEQPLASDGLPGTETGFDAGTGTATSDPAAIDTGAPTDEPTGTDLGSAPEEPTLTQDGSIPTGVSNATATDVGDQATDTLDPSAIETGDPTSALAESTVTITSYVTMTETITMEPVVTSAVNDLTPNDNPDFTSGIGTDGLFQSDSQDSNQHHPHQPHCPCGHPGHGGGCNKTVTVTITASNTDNLPIPPTASPSYGFGNGTDPMTGYPTASSGFLTFMRRSRPTKI